MVIYFSATGTNKYVAQELAKATGEAMLPLKDLVRNNKYNINVAEGENLGISPFVILVSLSLWGWLWGFMGLIIAVPLTVIIKIFCEGISFLRPIGILLGSGKIAGSIQKEDKKTHSNQ